jgi:hypothetical protein
MGDQNIPPAAGPQIDPEVVARMVADRIAISQLPVNVQSMAWAALRINERTRAESRPVPPQVIDYTAGMTERPRRPVTPASSIAAGSYKARFKCPTCPECGSKARVASKRKSIRYLQCTSESCGHRWQKPI